MSQTWLQIALVSLTVTGVLAVAMLTRVLFETWLLLRQMRSEWMPRIRDLLATTDETMGSVEGVTRMAREQAEGWSPLVTEARHTVEDVRDQVAEAAHRVEQTARAVESRLFRPLSRELTIWGHGLVFLGKQLAGGGAQGLRDEKPPSQQDEGGNRPPSRDAAT